MPAGHDGYEISTDPARLDRGLIARFLRDDAYWSPGIPAAVVNRAIDGSMVFGAYRGDEQVGFARVVTDRATFAWLADVFVVKAHRGAGLGKCLVEAVVAHPELKGLRRLLLATADAHSLYARYGFEPLSEERAGWFLALERDPAEAYRSGGTIA